jgi:hypothetical protein
MLFRYSTVNGVAVKNEHYLPKAETLRFEPGEVEKEISIELIEGVKWEPNDVFYVHLEKEKEDPESKTELGQCKVAEVIYLEENDSAQVTFVKNHEVRAQSDPFGCGQRALLNRQSKSQLAMCACMYVVLAATSRSVASHMKHKTVRHRMEQTMRVAASATYLRRVRCGILYWTQFTHPQYLYYRWRSMWTLALLMT